MQVDTLTQAPLVYSLAFHKTVSRIQCPEITSVFNAMLKLLQLTKNGTGKHTRGLVSFPQFLEQMKLD